MSIIIINNLITTTNLTIGNEKVKKRKRTKLREDEIVYVKAYYTKKLAQAKRIIESKKKQIFRKGFTPLVGKKQSRPKNATVKNVQVVLVVFLILVLILDSYTHQYWYYY